MRNIFIIGLIVIAMGYMVSILFDRYTSAIETQNSKKVVEKK